MKVLHPYVRNWLWLGVLMILVQIVLGGITRLTGSGLSITEWAPILGALPPLNHEQWMEAFEKYKQIPQYAKLNSHFTLSDFQYIYFWEYFHRLWARSIFIVFLIPFVIFLFKKWIPSKLILQLIIVVLLGMLQGLVGWIMVKSGLTDRIWVSPLKLSLHLITALLLVGYMVKISWKATIRNSQRQIDSFNKNFSLFLLLGLIVQIFFGGLMAGSHAATYFPTWPDMNGQAIPPYVFAQNPWWMNLLNNVATIQLFHRAIAYALMAGIFFYCVSLLRNHKGDKISKVMAIVLAALILLQPILGIITLLASKSGTIPILWGVLHQFVGLVLFCVMLCSFLYLKWENKQQLRINPL